MKYLRVSKSIFFIALLIFSCSKEEKVYSLNGEWIEEDTCYILNIYNERFSFAYNNYNFYPCNNILYYYPNYEDSIDKNSLYEYIYINYYQPNDTILYLYFNSKQKIDENKKWHSPIKPDKIVQYKKIVQKKNTKKVKKIKKLEFRTYAESYKYIKFIKIENDSIFAHSWGDNYYYEAKYSKEYIHFLEKILAEFNFAEFQNFGSISNADYLLYVQFEDSEKYFHCSLYSDYEKRLSVLDTRYRLLFYIYHLDFRAVYRQTNGHFLDITGWGSSNKIDSIRKSYIPNLIKKYGINEK